MASINLPRPEYPRPQYRREEWCNLNGSWSFEEDRERVGLDQQWLKRDLAEIIQVPFCRESELSGIHRDDQVPCVWYQREIVVPKDWSGGRTLLHFGAADYLTHVWLDGAEVGHHRGGHTSFTFDLTEHVRPGSRQRLTVRCEDDPALPKPHGKQRRYGENSGCHYVQTTGIWQTVWLEPVPMTYLARPRITPLVDAGAFLLEQKILHPTANYRVEAVVKKDGRVISRSCLPVVHENTASIYLPLDEADRQLWEPGRPFLYDIEIRLLDEDSQEIDKVSSYAGLRSVAIRGDRVLINGKSVFQRLILDQGYYPDGLLTAPSDAALVEDIQIGLRHGFNGARLHQKVFEERALYHADRLGYLVWGELPDWGPEFQRDEPKTINARWIEEWLEAVERDYSHPCIIGWCPLNEQEGQNPQHLAELETVQRSLVLATKLADRTRPVLDASGWVHRCPESDIYDDHNYEQDPETLAATYSDLSDFSATSRGAPDNIGSAGKPFFLSELGGMVWVEGRDKPDGAWGYGKAPVSKEEYIDRFTKQCRVFLKNPACFGYCITQLTDVFQEMNGLTTFDRREKFDSEILRAAQSIPAAIEACEE